MKGYYNKRSYLDHRLKLDVYSHQIQSKKSMLAAIGAAKTAQVFGFFFIKEDNQHSLLQSAIFRAHACNFKLVLVSFVYCPRRKLLSHKVPRGYDRVTPEAASLIKSLHGVLSESAWAPFPCTQVILRRNYDRAEPRSSYALVVCNCIMSVLDKLITLSYENNNSTDLAILKDQRLKTNKLCSYPCWSGRMG